MLGWFLMAEKYIIKSNMRIPIVNEQDNLLYFKDKSERDKRKEITRSSSLIIFNKKGEVLLAKRSKNKKNSPNVWGPSAEGPQTFGEFFLFFERLAKRTSPFSLKIIRLEDRVISLRLSRSLLSLKYKRLSCSFTIGIRILLLIIYFSAIKNHPSISTRPLVNAIIRKCKLET